MPGHEMIQSELDTSQEGENSGENVLDSMSDTVSEIDAVSGRGCDKLTTAVGFISLLLISLQMRSY